MTRSCQTIVAVAAVLAAGCIDSGERQTNRRQPIVNGMPSAGSDPAVVGVVARRLQCDAPAIISCTGTLIAPRVVLTAAHCVPPNFRRGGLEVFFGDDVTGPGTFQVVVDAAIHPDYDDATKANDAALLLLSEAATTTPLALPTGSVADLAPAADVRVVGFGSTVGGTEDTGTKRQGVMSVGEVRAGAFDAAPNPALSCVGDSGGPVFGTINAQEQLLGITSKGDLLCETVATNQRVDVLVTDFVDPFITMADSAPPGWPSDAPALQELNRFVCQRDEDCPAAMYCDDAGDGTNRCMVAGLGPGSYAGTCAQDADCGADEQCARVWPNECRCFKPQMPIGPPADAGDTTPPGGDGCCSAGGRPRSGDVLLGLLCIALLSVFRQKAKRFS